MRKQLWITALFVALLTIAAHVRCLQNDFVLWDDDTHITQNVAVRSLAWENIRTMFTQPIAKLYCPFTWLSFAIDYQIWGRDPFGYHFTNFVLHLANTLLVLIIVGAVCNHNRGYLIAFFTAALFGVHPLHVESVAWATERKDVLFTFFYLFALLVYLRRGNIWLCFSLFVASALSKSTAVTFPVILLLLDAFVLHRRAWLEKLPFFTVSLIIGVVTILAQAHGAGETLADTNAIPVVARVGLVGYCALFYVGKFFWPLHLSAIYLTFDELHVTLWCSVGLIAITSLIFVLRKRAPVLWAGWLFYLIALSPTIGIAPVGIHVVADRYAYLALLGLILPVASLTAKKFWPVVLGVVVLLLTVQSVQRAAIWKNTETLFLAAIDYNPNCLPAHINLTKWYTSLGEYDKAIIHGRKAVEIAPAGTPGRLNLAIALKRAGQVDESIKVWPAIADQP